MRPSSRPNPEKTPTSTEKLTKRPRANALAKPLPPTPEVMRAVRLARLADELALKGTKGARERARWANIASEMGVDDGEEKMLTYVLKTARLDHLPPARTDIQRRIALRALFAAAKEGEAVLGGILRGSHPSTTPLQAKKDIRAVMWALYKRAIMKDQPFVGGMIVLDDQGRLAQFLKNSGVAWYDRPSSHFQARRNESLGMDFHEDDLRLPLQKRTLHFGTLNGSDATFVKFEYYGFKTKKDIFGHSVEYIEVVALDRKEVGFREDPSQTTLQALETLLKHPGLRGKEPTKLPRGVKNRGEFTLAKAGTYYARVLIEEHLTGAEQKAALAALDALTPFDHKELRQGNEVILGKGELGLGATDLLTLESLDAPTTPAATTTTTTTTTAPRPPPPPPTAPTPTPETAPRVRPRANTF